VDPWYIQSTLLSDVVAMDHVTRDVIPNVILHMEQTQEDVLALNTMWILSSSKTGLQCVTYNSCCNCDVSSIHADE
jgi:hypothetical protein